MLADFTSFKKEVPPEIQRRSQTTFVQQIEFAFRPTEIQFKVILSSLEETTQRQAQVLLVIPTKQTCLIKKVRTTQTKTF